MKTSLLEQELAPLNAQIEKTRGTLAGLEREMCVAEAELESHSAERLRIDLLRDACTVLERLEELEAGQLFWGDVPELKDPAGHMARLRKRIDLFDEKIRTVLERETKLKAQANRCLDELDILEDEVRNVYARDERRENEFAIERELSPVPYHPALMPWSTDGESDRRYRRTLATAMLLSILFTIIIRLVVLPAQVRPVVAQVPERLAMMVRKEHKKPEPAKKAKEEKKEKKKEEKAKEQNVAKKEDKPQADKPRDKPAQEPAKAAERSAAPRRSETAGVMAFKESFKDLLEETAVPKLGTEARLKNTTQTAGQALASRSLVAMQSGVPGGGGGSAAVSRNVGSGGIGTAGTSRSGGSGEGNSARLGRGGAGFTQVKSVIAGGEGKGKDSRPLSSGARPARTDEEIQILFDRYKAALYRIYNTDLRKNPTLRGKMVLRITIEPSGAVSACGVESSNMDAPEFSSQIVDRVKKFNFGPKEGVPTTTILYPIDFLPAR